MPAAKTSLCLARFVGLLGLVACVLFTFPGNARAADWSGVDVTGAAPRLRFTLTDANTGKQVTARDFHGKIVLLYLGYTHCPDVCPLTLQRVTTVLSNLGTQRRDVRMLFVTVDPARDTLPLLRQYTAAFAPEIIGLRGTAQQIARLAKRYRLAYSVSPATATHAYEVTHSSAIYVFNRNGRARLLEASLASRTPDLKGVTQDLRRLINAHGGGAMAWLDQAL